MAQDRETCKCGKFSAGPKLGECSIQQGNERWGWRHYESHTVERCLLFSQETTVMYLDTVPSEGKS